MINYDNTVLVLEGGGLRGVFTCGVLDCFMDHHIRFPFTAGVSAGAFYRKYPQLQKALSERNSVYNRTMDMIEGLEDQDRMEKDTARLRALYQEGYDIAKELISRNG